MPERQCTGSAEVELSAPVKGRWPFKGFPSRVRLSLTLADPTDPKVVDIGPRVFAKAKLQQPYPGVVEQYREEVPENSLHLKVLSDGTYLIDHRDRYNPDQAGAVAGSPVSHFLKDHPLGHALSFIGLIVGVATAIDDLPPWPTVKRSLKGPVSRPRRLSRKGKG